MIELKHECLCIRSMDYKENDKLITLYAFGKGKITATCRGVKKPKAKLKYASSILCFGTYYLSGRNGYYTVTGCDLIDSFYKLWGDIDKFYPALSSIEMLDKFSGDSEISDNLATSTLLFLKTLCYENIDNIPLHFLKYLYNTLAIIGYEIAADSCISCGNSNGKNAFFSASKGGVVYECCRAYDSEKLTAEQVDILSVLAQNYLNELSGDYSLLVNNKAVEIDKNIKGNNIAESINDTSKIASNCKNVSAGNNEDRVDNIDTLNYNIYINTKNLLFSEDANNNQAENDLSINNYNFSVKNIRVLIDILSGYVSSILEVKLKACKEYVDFLNI